MAYSDLMLTDREDHEETIDTINPLDLVTYKRLQGQCDKTVLNGVDNSKARARDLWKNQQKPPVSVNQSTSHDVNDEDSDLSDLTNGTSKRLKSSAHTIRTDGSVGTRQSQVNAAVEKAGKQWTKKLEQ